MEFLAFWILAMFISSVVCAEEELPLANQVLAEDGEAEGRTCYDCHGGDAYGQDEHHQQNTEIYQYTKDMSWMWGMGGVALTVLPLLAVNIVGVVLLSVLLKKVEELYDHQTYNQPAYAYSTYQPQGHSSSSTYTKRSAAEGLGFPSQSTLQFLTGVIGDAIKKYSDIDTAK